MNFDDYLLGCDILAEDTVGHRGGGGHGGGHRGGGGRWGGRGFGAPAFWGWGHPDYLEADFEEVRCVRYDANGNCLEYKPVDILGAESKITVEDVTPPAVTWTTSPTAPKSPTGQQLPTDMMYGPGASSGTYYTDRATITAVQKKLAALGYYHGNIDGIYGPLINTAIKNYSGKDGPPDDALLNKLGLRKEIASFEDEVIESTVLQAKQVQTQPQLKAAADQLVAIAPPQLQQEAARVQMNATIATTPQQVAQVKRDMMTVAQKIYDASPRRMPPWKVGVIAASTVVGAGALVGLLTLLRRK